MITGKINLASLEHAIVPMKSKTGESIDCLVIPIKKNNLFKSEKGNVYLDFAAFEVAPEKRKGEDTHLIVQSFDKAKREAMKAAGEQSAILGNLRASEYSSEAAPNISTEFTPSDFAGGGNSDLPF